MNMPAKRDNGAVTERPENPLVKLRGQLEQRGGEFGMVLPSHITPEKFQRTVITAAQQNPKLLKCDRQSLVTACMKAAQDGLLPDGREAALVPFEQNYKDGNEWKKRLLVQYLPMTFGIRKKILQSGEVRDVYTAVVYRQEIEDGLFIYEEGSERTLRHKPLLDPKFEPKDEDIAAAYSVATFNDGTMSFEVLRRAEINKIRETSQTGATRDKKGNARTPSGPWVDWFSEMCRKSAIKRHSKTLPMSGDIQDDDDYAFDAGRSTQNVLGAVDADAPVIIPGRDELDQITYDSDTGEVLDNQVVDNSNKKEPAKTRAKKSEPPSQSSDTPPGTGGSQPSSAESEAADDNQSSADEGQGAASDEKQGDDDQWDIWLDDVRQKLMQATTIPDLNSTWSNLRKDLEAAPAEIAGSAEASFTTRLKALKEGK
ncbi:MAG: recombinase RecT [Pseudomonadota bacterium]|nr:recombinase RecT [Pseudomonadota bacterium]